MALETVLETDILVIGGGIAGCFAAIKAREQGADVTLVDKGYVSKSGASNFAGGYFIIFNPEWGHDLDAWIEQISTKGEYLNNREWNEIILKNSYARYRDLISWGINFVEEEDELKKQSRAQHFQTNNMWRKKWTPFLRKQAVTSGIKIIDRMVVTDLVKQDGKVVGAVGFHSTSGNLYILLAKATVIAAGSGSFKPAGLPISFLTGDSEGMAYRAGAEITGKEFPDWHFTMADFPAWRGHGISTVMCSRYVNAEGEKVIRSAPAAFEFEAHAGRAPIFWNLDAATPEEIKAMQHHQRTTGTLLECERAGVDVTRGGKIPMTGGAFAGASVHQAEGIWPVNTKCATSLAGLYAAGDALGTRQIGTVYPGKGFGLCGSSVTGAIAGGCAAEYALQTERPVKDSEVLASLREAVFAPVERKGGFSPGWVTQLLQSSMIPYFVMSIKHGERLQAALTQVKFMRNHLVPKLTARDAHELRMAHETKNMVLNSEMILRASLFRTESRGSHYREDYPRRDDPAWLVWVKIKEEQGEMKLSKEAIPKEWWPDLSKPYEERYPARFPGE